MPQVHAKSKFLSFTLRESGTSAPGSAGPKSQTPVHFQLQAETTYCFFIEIGISWILPEGAPEGREWGRLPHLGGYLTWADPFVLAHPELRIKRRADDVPACAWPSACCDGAGRHADRNPTRVAAPIHTIRLTKK
ncbi:MAG: hypothetical protein HY360_21760 [Verrucomicrobia bacterium]|nr:hypothetical protein [Verrucomicrobiota bacterium]